MVIQSRRTAAEMERESNLKSDEFSIRTLGAQDLDAMRGMLEVFAEAFDDAESYRSAPPGDAYLERMLGGDSFIALAALDGCQVIGGIAAYDLQKFEQERSEIYIYDLAVAPSHQRRGVATALIGELKRVAKARRAWVIFVQADLGDEPAIALYEKLGVREDVLHFDIPPES
jgi:aminoglycoside 3-N-acetyltransferase I